MTMLRAFALVLAVAAAPALAQVNDTPDASAFPDASVGQGGADQSSPETDDSGKACVYSSDCASGFTCVNQACQYTKGKNANFLGCTASPAGALLVAAIFALALRRRA